MTPHLRGQVRGYVDRTLPPAVQHVYDRHLVTCQLCCYAADQERRIVAALRADTAVPQSLRSALIGLAGAASPPGATAGPAVGPGLPGVTSTGAFADGGPRVPAPPAGLRMPLAAVRGPLPTVPPTSPALHRSPMRAAVVASLAAGASVAAAWSLAVTPLPTASFAAAAAPGSSVAGSAASGTSASGASASRGSSSGSAGSAGSSGAAGSSRASAASASGSSASTTGGGSTASSGVRRTDGAAAAASSPATTGQVSAGTATVVFASASTSVLRGSSRIFVGGPRLAAAPRVASAVEGLAERITHAVELGTLPSTADTRWLRGAARSSAQSAP